MDIEEISSQVREFLLKELLTDEDGSSIENSTPLISTGVLNSLATLKLVAFLEDTYEISVKAREVGIDYMDSISDMASLVQSKLQG